MFEQFFVIGKIYSSIIRDITRQGENDAVEGLKRGIQRPNGRFFRIDDDLLFVVGLCKRRSGPSEHAMLRNRCEA